LSGKLQVFF